MSHYFSASIVERLETYLSLIQQSICGEYALIHQLVDHVHQIETQSPEHWLHIKQHKERISRYARIIALDVADQYALDDELIETSASSQLAMILGNWPCQPTFCKNALHWPTMKKSKFITILNTALIYSMK